MNAETSKNMKYHTDTIYHSTQYHSHVQIHMYIDIELSFHTTYTYNICSNIQHYQFNICCRHNNMSHETT